MLSPDPNSPPVPETSVRPDLLHPLHILSQASIESLSEDLSVLPGLEVLLPVEEPEGNLELLGGLNDSDDLLDLIGRKLPRPLVNVNLRLLADKVGETTSDTLNLGKGKDNVALTLNVGVEDTQNVLELGALH